MGKATLGALLGLLLCAKSAYATGGAHYLFDEGLGSVAIDSSGAGNNGTITGATYVPGYQGTALRFSTNGAVLVPSSVFSGFGNTAYFSAWVNPSAYPQGPFGCDSTIFRKRAEFNDWIVGILKQGQLNCSFPGASGNGGTIPLNTWSKVACWYDGTSMHATINDIEVATTPAHITLDWQSGYHRTEVGNDTYDNGINCIDYSFRGAIDNVTIASATPTSTPPSASFTWTPQAPTLGQQAQFTDTSSGNPTSWSWSFGDGATSTARNPTHSYTNAGTYTVTETVAANGVSSTISHAVDVHLPASCVPTTQFPFMRSGQLSPACVSIDLRGHLAKFFTFSVQAPTMLAARLSLSNVDAHLSLLAGNNEFGRVLATDERSGGGSPAKSIPYAARLSCTLAPGTYTLEVTTAAPISTAASYRLQANIAQPMVEQFADQKTFEQRWKRSDYQNKCKPQEPCPIPPNGGTTFDPNKVNTRTTGLVTLLLQGNKGAEIMSVRDDFHYGKYFFLAAAPDTQNLKSPQGSVFGLFALQKNQYFKTNEIDVELLTRWYDPDQASLIPTPGTVFFATHDGGGTQTNLSPSVLRGRAVWYGFDWTPTSVTFYVFANNHGRIGSQLAMRTIYSSPTDETIIVINTWAGNINYGGTYPALPVYSAIYQVQYYPAFFPDVSAAH